LFGLAAFVYAEGVGCVRCTHYEAEFAKNNGKRIILLRMIPWGARFAHLQARVLFGMNNLELSWMQEMPMPESLPGDIVAALKGKDEEEGDKETAA